MEQEFFHRLERKQAVRPQAGAPLSQRQQDIVLLIAKGKRNREIAQALGLSEGTVKMYISSEIFPRLGVKNRAAVAIWFYQCAMAAICGIFLGRSIQ